MGYFLAFPVLLIMMMLQSAIFSRLMILHGTADLLLISVAAWTLQERVQNGWFWALLAALLAAYISVVPPLIPIISYFGTMIVARLLQIRIWQTSILAMFLVVIAGTLIQHLVSIVVLNVFDWTIPVIESLTQITLPSILLNLFLALPIYVLLNSLARAVYPAIEG
jgi:hypothetical protein